MLPNVGRYNSRYSHVRQRGQNTRKQFEKSGAPGEIRTPDLLLRRLSKHPRSIQNQSFTAALARSYAALSAAIEHILNTSPGAAVGSGPLVPFRIVSATTETIRQTGLKRLDTELLRLRLDLTCPALYQPYREQQSGKNISFRRAFHRGSDYLESARPRTRSPNLEQAQLDSEKI